MRIGGHKLPNVLLVLNAPRQQELDRVMSLNNLARSRDISLFFLTRHLSVSNLAFPIFGSLELNSSIEIFEDDESFATKVVEEEILHDRQFIRSQELRYRNRSRLPIRKDALYSKIARRILEITGFTNPQFAATGAPDNWISVSVARIYSHLSIEMGYLFQIANSKNYLICNSMHYTNSLITKDLFLSSIDNMGPKPNVSEIRLEDVRNEVTASRKLSLTQKIRNMKLVFAWQKFYLGELFSYPRILFKGYEFSHPRIPFISLWRSFVMILVRGMNRTILDLLIKLSLRSLLNSEKRRCLVMLHVSPEAGPLVMAREFSSQIDFALKLKESLPKEFSILIKEHPAQDLGLRPLTYYLRFYFKGFRLVPRSFFPESLNKSRDLIATMNGTVVLEALDFHCQVILANANTWHSMLPNTILLEDLQNSEHVPDLVDTYESPISSRQALSVLSKLDCVITAPNDDSAEIFMIEKSIT